MSSKQFAADLPVYTLDSEQDHPAFGVRMVTSQGTDTCIALHSLARDRLYCSTVGIHTMLASAQIPVNDRTASPTGKSCAEDVLAGIAQSITFYRACKRGDLLIA